MFYQKTIEGAIEFATEAHRRQVDKAGEPYIKHCIAVYETAKHFFPDDEHLLMAALLHDVIEDTEVDFITLEMTFGSDVAVLVQGVTKTGLSYEQYKKNILSSRRLSKIKMCDLLHNMDISRIAEPSESDLRRLKKYKQFYSEIVHELNDPSLANIYKDVNDECIDG